MSAVWPLRTGPLCPMRLAEAEGAPVDRPRPLRAVDRPRGQRGTDLVAGLRSHGAEADQHAQLPCENAPY
jgi:hypothetical protein